MNSIKFVLYYICLIKIIKIMEMTFDTFIKKIQDCKENKIHAVEDGTRIYFTMHDLVQDEEMSQEYGVEKLLIHIPTNTKIFIAKSLCCHAYPSVFIQVPGISHEIWIGDDLEYLFHEATSKEGNINAFNFPYRQEEYF